MKRTVAEVSAETIRAESALSALKVGESMSYDVLRDIIGLDPMKEGRHALYSARKRLFREHRMVLACIPGEGITRLGDVEMVAHGDNVLQRVRRAAKRGMAVVLAVDDFNALPKDLQTRHNTTALVLGSVAVLTGKPGQRKITAKVAEARALTEQEIKAIAETI